MRVPEEGHLPFLRDLVILGVDFEIPLPHGFDYQTEVAVVGEAGGQRSGLAMLVVWPPMESVLEEGCA
jgi:hypothetical protein